MRHETQVADIHRFMQCLGAAVREPGRIYFTGGVSAVLHGWRETTVDIDLNSDPEPAGFFEAIRQLREELEVNIELACPADFIPAPPGWRERSVFIARCGSLDFFHFDFYSQALAKIERGYDRDLADVRRMIADGLVQRPKLQECFAQIQVGLLRFPAIDPASFERKLTAFLAT